MMASIAGKVVSEQAIGEMPASERGLSHRERFLKACACEPVDRAPIWLMRQAGRCLPEYRALKERYEFTELVQTPEMAAEVTLQPIRRFGFDGAIVFSDILAVPEALGQRYQFRAGGGIDMEFRLDSAEAVDRLDVDRVPERLQYVAEAIKLTRHELGRERALLGFAGSPWTLANYMMEGGSVKEFARARTLFYNDRELFDQLCGKLTEAVIQFLRLQIQAGVDVIQIFDSLGGLLADNCFEAASGRWIKRIIESLGPEVPVILFAKGVHGSWDVLAHTGAQGLSVDWSVKLSDIRRRLPDTMCVQGNLDPCVLNTRPEIVEAETKRLLSEMQGCNGHIFNLGHGVPPTSKIENIETLVETVKDSV